MLRVARLLLVGSAAAALGSLVFIVSRAASLSPVLSLFVAPAVLFMLAAVSLEQGPRRGRLLAAAGACALAGAGTLAGFGAGEVTFPAAALGVLAAWSALLWRAPRPAWLAFAGYLAVGLVLSAEGLRAMAGAAPFLLPSLLIWPLRMAFAVPGAGGLIPIYACFGLAVALGAAAYVRPPAFSERTGWIVLARDAVLGGVVFLVVEIALAVARPSTSARHELVPVAVAVIFGSAALLVLGVRLLRAGVGGGLAATAIGAAVAVYILASRPTVECAPNGTSTTSGPWWLPYGGGLMSGGSGGGIGSSGGIGFSEGAIRRNDGVTITYRCEAGSLVQFDIERSPFKTGR